MDLISGVIFVGIRLAVVLFFGIAVWRLDGHPRQATRPAVRALTA